MIRSANVWLHLNRKLCILRACFFFRSRGQHRYRCVRVWGETLCAWCCYTINDMHCLPSCMFCYAVPTRYALFSAFVVSFSTRMLLSSSNVVSYYKLRSSLARAHFAFVLVPTPAHSVCDCIRFIVPTQSARLLACSCDCTSFNDDDEYWQIIFYALFSGYIDF